MIRAPAAGGNSSPSIAGPSRTSFWRASFSATPAARSPERCGTRPASSRRPTGGRFFSTRSGTCPSLSRPSFSALLQEKEIRRVGENRTRAVDVRFITATNKDLDREIEAGRFREDLFYRLRIVTIEIPPLRERRDDLLLLLNHFAEKYGREMKKEQVYFTPGALDLLMRYAWPGNVRELQNEIQRSLILCGEDRFIREEYLSPKINPSKRCPANGEITISPRPRRSSSGGS